MANDKVIPILPCPDVRQHATFYEQLGFEIRGLYVSPNPYVVLQYKAIELHFYGTKKVLPTANSSMCYVSVEDIDAVYNNFITALKTHTGKVPRTGLPRISKIRDLKLDRRFTLTDPGGNTFYIGSPKKKDEYVFFRTIGDEAWTKKFAVLYDVLHSKEDPGMAAEMLPKFKDAFDLQDALDSGKFLLLVVDIQKQTGAKIEDIQLKNLINAHKGSNEDWRRIESMYRAVLSED